MTYTRLNSKIGFDTLEVVTESNAYVSPWGAYKEVSVLHNVAVASCWVSSANPSSVCVHSNGTILQVYSKTPATVYVRLLYVP